MSFRICWYMMFAFIAIASTILGVVRGYQESVNDVVDTVEQQENKIIIESQKEVIKQQHIAFSSSQKQVKQSIKIKQNITSTKTFEDKINLQNKIITNINCNIKNSDSSVCDSL